MDERQIMVSLGDARAKEIAEVIGNKSCVKILDLLANGELTVGEISKKLKMPINTVDYNVKKLVRARLIEKANHWWSVKGKKMPTYRVSNLKIVISPRKTIGTVFAWVIGLTGLSALTIREFTRDKVVQVASDVARTYGEVSLEISPQGSDVAQMMLKGVETAGNFSSFFHGINSWQWFLMGAWFAVLLFFAITILQNKMKGGKFYEGK